MGLTDWMGSFDRARVSDLSLELEQAYEAALLIQGLELEYYNDRPVRPELELSIPRQTQAQMLRRFRAALQLCRNTLADLAKNRSDLDSQELRRRTPSNTPSRLRGSISGEREIEGRLPATP